MKELARDKALTPEDIEKWQKEAPYFVLPVVNALRHGKGFDDKERKKLLNRAAVQASDREALYDLIGDDTGQFRNFYPNRGAKPSTSTEGTIDSFLETFGHGSRRETEALTKLIFSPVPDYAATLAAEELKMRRESEQATKPNESEKPETKTETLIKPESEPENNSDNDKENTDNRAGGNLSESFAKIMIKNGNYEKALEIIIGLNLNNPEKSIYFAHQIRFLRKLIINKQRKITH